jgi:membrane-associated HD superfamily phosphohydrolase
MDGQAESAPESGGLTDLASFLSDTPEEESTEEIEATPADESTAESDTDEEANNEQDDEPEQSDEEPAPVDTKITFKVKGEDGTEETVEASTEELAASYLRQKDYTRKTQALAERESQAVEFLKTKHEEVRNQYLTQAEIARTAVIQMAGLKTGDEMAQLAHSDPAAWVAENQRQQQINAYLNSLDQQIGGEKQRAMQEAEAQRQQSLKQQFNKTWEVLQQEKIDKPALAKIYEGVNKTYGFSQEELANVYDHRLVKMMRDAQAYQSLKAQKADVTRKVSDAPRMPVRQTSQAETKREQALENRFKGGRAKLNDLASYLR